MSTGIRRRARWYALQVLYALDLNPDQDPGLVALAYAGDFDLDIDDRSIDFARMLIQQAVTHQGEVDDVIQSASRNWRLERMSRVDRNILRLATAELYHARDIPVRVVINEAVELAKRFGAAESPAFVNGILDRIAQNVGRE